MTKTTKRPRDTNQLAKFVIDAATVEAQEHVDTAKVTRAKKAGAAGGPARARALSHAERSEIARIAADARWKKGD